MKTTTFGLILFSVTLSALAQVSFKLGVSGRTGQTVPDGQSLLASFLAMATPGVIGGLVLYGFGTLLWLQVLARTSLSQAYPFVGLGFVLTSLFGVFLFGETVTPLRGSGILLVTMGIYAIARS
ncbi:small multi-drug resistant family protein [Lichenicola cladoniae]|jgi:multidrug transporter EmrE-like cation transporter|uniref:Small multi-drug resistant family protein n=1 Tax=Lichenicola cladoniae TaxID=1484109 RepID=A0A6M8HU44_9PROT|nr:small multi-drug resistant family protein [Lichenicola cladoniae]NPD67639.1 small multi-drug resistant family protein [Acetobacteraceae bacterium]QKE91721.1 small multi-drug resistant family protein [Lichenicola cladoniae]